MARAEPEVRMTGRLPVLILKPELFGDSASASASSSAVAEAGSLQTRVPQGTLMTRSLPALPSCLRFL